MILSPEQYESLEMLNLLVFFLQLTGMKWVVGFSFFLFCIFRSIWDICVCFLFGIKQQSKPYEGDVSREQWCLAHGQWGKSSHFLSGPTWEMAKAVLSPVVPVQMTAGGDPWGVPAVLLF